MDAAAFRDIRHLVDALAAAINAHAAALDALDAAIGDGDHGATLARGFSRAAEAVAREPSDDPGVLLRAAGRALLTMGGASGPLFGTMFLEAGQVVLAHPAVDQASLTADAVIAMLAAAAAGVRRRGNVTLGEKTLYDALAPAVDGARAAAQAGGGVLAVIDAAAAAAHAGAERTRVMTARKGRAAFLADRSAGHPDPGAFAVAILLEAIAQHCRRYGASAGAR